MSHQDFVEQFSRQSSAELRNSLLTEVHTTGEPKIYSHPVQSRLFDHRGPALGDDAGDGRA